MKCFGSPDTFVEGASSDLKLGRLVANFQFLRALLTYGDFDEYHLFCPTQHHLKLLSAAIERDIPDPQIRARVRLMHHLQLPGQLKSTPYQAFHVGGWYFYYLRLAYLRAQCSVRPFALTGLIHSLNTPDIQERMRDLLEAPMCAGDAIVMTSECGRQVMANYEASAAARLKEKYGVDARFAGQTPVIPLAVPESALVPSDKGAAREALHLSKTDTVLLYMGRLSLDTKGDLTPLLYVMKQGVDKHGPSLKLVLAGGANLANQRMLNATIQSLGLAASVRVMPNITDAVKAYLYAAADVFVAPIDSLQETFGISILEAMAAGLPVVASAFNGYRELVISGETGFLLPTLWGASPSGLVQMGVMMEPSVSQLVIAQNVSTSSRHMASALNQLIENPALRSRMGEAGKKRVSETYTWPVVIKQYLSLWSDLQRRLPATPPTSGADPTWSDFHQIFAQYPTHQLTGDQWFSLSDLGRLCATGALPLPMMVTELSPLYQRTTWVALIEWLAQRPVSWTQMQAHPTLGGTQIETTRFHLLWFVKYGLLQVDGLDP